DRDDGLWSAGPDGIYDARRSPYNEWLKAQGYPGPNPWQDHANAGVGPDGEILSGWYLRNSGAAANIREQDSETPWLTRRCMDFLGSEQAASAPWLCHLSYIKPHWPYIVPEPWASLYGPDQVIPPVRDLRERQNPHPIFGAFMGNRVGQAFSRDEVRAAVIPAYMGLIAQCDAEFGRLLDHLEATGRLADTMIVLTSDHGDYLGDHWMGEKDLFHDPSARIPLIIYDPRAEADATRGTVCDALVESIDLAPTFLEAVGAPVPGHVLEGLSLQPWLHGQAPAVWRRAVVSEYDWATSPMASDLNVAPRDARLMMVFDGRWKLMHAEGGFRPMLFDLLNDPQELVDLGDSADHAGVIAAMYDHLHAWARRMSQRTTVSDAQILARRQGSADRVGVLIGVPSEADADPEMAALLRGTAQARFV
ncbi:MAG: sulfatase-like hydrolase/transferase, partial [Gemmobacter sp.]|nr:sulfatase-like hydrolase/transferase [Gemmobacter sp.]